MAVTAVKKTATPCRLTFLLAQDGAAGTTLVIANATLQAAMEAGPLKDAFNKSYVTDGVSVTSAIQSVVGGGLVRMSIDRRTAAAAGGLNEDGDWAVFADTDVATPAKPELNVAAGVLACDAWLVIEYAYSIIQ